MVSPNCKATPSKRATREVPMSMSTSELKSPGTPRAATDGFFSMGAYTLALLAAKLKYTMAYSPLVNNGSSTAVPSCANSAADVPPGSPSQSVSPRMQGPVFTPTNAVSEPWSYANRTSLMSKPDGVKVPSG